jgi:hypothetical protein
VVTTDPKIALVGCGFLGSLWAEEVFKRLWAVDRFDVGFLFIDNDTWEERNCANQLVCAEIARQGEAKSYTLSKRARMYDLQAEHSTTRITESNRKIIRADIIVDALDNLESRWLLHYQGIESGAPVLHLGINNGGSGSVEWVVDDHDFWHMSPKRVAVLPEAQQIVQPPCHLVQSRGLGLNTALAGAKAFTLAIGEDIEETLKLGPQLPYSVYTQWDTDNNGHWVDKERIHVKTPQEEGSSQDG